MEQWNHLTVTFNSSIETLKFFLNGELVFENIYSGMEIYNYNHWINIGAITRKGGNTEFNFWNGMLDDIGIWNRALTEQYYMHFDPNIEIIAQTKNNLQKMNLRLT